MEVLKVTGLSKTYPQFSLRDVSFTVHAGEIMGLIGRNGAGKTTTLRSLLNFVHPDCGEIQFFGLPFPARSLEIKQKIGFVSGGIDFYVRKPLRTITSVTRRFYPDWDDAAYRRYLAEFQLEESKTPAALSSGMRVKYSLALALSHKAQLLILDEPSSGLDPISRDELLDIFLQLKKENVSILFSTHITSDLEKCADRITYIRNGRIAACDELTHFTEQYRVVFLDEAAHRAPQVSQLIGCKPAKGGYTALAASSEAAALPFPSQPANLETIMVHLEKESV